MNFVTLSALAIGLLGLVPILAHLLKRGKTATVEFPPVSWVPKTLATSPRRSRLADRMLLALRLMMVLAMAALGATPLVTCSELSVSRPAGGNVALAIVLDDSQSMQNLAQGQSRWELARQGALDLFKSTRPGDSVSITLSGYPARAVLTPTGDLGAAQHVLEALVVSDRSSDLTSAVQLARAGLKSLPHEDKRLVVLSDLADAPLPEGEPAAWLPIESLRQAWSNCGLASAERRGQQADVVVGCSDPRAAERRRLSFVDADGNTLAPPPPSPSSAEAPSPAPPPEPVLRPSAGQQRLTLSLPEHTDVSGWQVVLTGNDDNAQDNRAPLGTVQRDLAVAVVSDPANSAAASGGRGVIEQALVALDPDLGVHPLTVLPQEATELEPFGVLLIDDPAGLSPESRSAVSEWMELHGGTALALLGPAAASSQLASTLEPFAEGATRWEEGAGFSLDASSLRWLGEEGATLSTLTRTGRLRLDGCVPKLAVVLGQWEDGVPWLYRQTLGKGEAYTLGLPASPTHSDLALRPGFLALLGHVLHQAALKVGPSRSLAGETWSFASGAHVEIRGVTPAPELTRVEPCTGSATDPNCDPSLGQIVAPARTGRYQVQVDDDVEERVVTLDPQELITLPRALDPANAGIRAASTSTSLVDTSRQVALLLLALFALELALRAWSRPRTLPEAQS